MDKNAEGLEIDNAAPCFSLAVPKDAPKVRLKKGSTVGENSQSWS